jgi:hypothetical protein
MQNAEIMKKNNKNKRSAIRIKKSRINGSIRISSGGSNVNRNKMLWQTGLDAGILAVLFCI